MQNLLVSVVLTTLIYGHVSGVCDEPNWIPYKDQKCIRILTQFVDHKQAESVCANEFQIGSTYPSAILQIRTPAEQEAITRHIFNYAEVVDSVWLSAQQVYNGSDFTWPDGSVLDYSNWGDLNPVADDGRPCVEMRSNYSQKSFAEGQWFNVPCNKRNLVVCEALPIITMEELKTQLNEAIRRLEFLENLVITPPPPTVPPTVAPTTEDPIPEI